MAGKESDTVILSAYSVGDRWGWVAIRLGPEGGGAEQHDSGLRYADLDKAQTAGEQFVGRYWHTRPRVLRVNGTTMKGRRVETRGW